MKFETISVVGLGYIGLPTAAMFASCQIKVIGVDVVQSTVDTINRGDIHIVEPDLDIVVKNAVADGYLRAVTKPEESDAFLIAVPTPFKGDHQPDLKYVKSAAQAIAKVLKKGDLVILESTSPVGTTEMMVKWLAEERGDLTFPEADNVDSDIRVAYCPERVLPGKVMTELIKNDRIIGGMTEACTTMASELYGLFVEGECVTTNAKTAEMAKLTENSFRDVNIAFANELSMICDQLDINVWELIELSNRHPRVNILNPGPGVGGHCIAVDPWFIVSAAPEKAKLIRCARQTNDLKPEFIIEKLGSLTNKISKPKIGCLGLAFKANIDDLRESPALKIVTALADQKGLNILAVEPNITELPAQLANRKNVRLVDVEDAIKDADVVLGLVNHNQFFDIKVKNVSEGKVVLDTCGIWT